MVDQFPFIAFILYDLEKVTIWVFEEGVSLCFRMGAVALRENYSVNSSQVDIGMNLIIGLRNLWYLRHMYPN